MRCAWLTVAVIVAISAGPSTAAPARQAAGKPASGDKSAKASAAESPADKPRFQDAVFPPPARLAPVRAITRGPKFHWFGYYDKLQFDPTGRYVLGAEVDFEHRSPGPDDQIKVGMVDLHDNDRWIELGTSRAWCWQQGCHLQWRPGSASEVLWNDRQEGRFVCRVLDTTSGRARTLPFPIDTIAPDGQWALGVDFARVADRRPGYGYAGVDDPNRHVAAPADSGVYKVNLDTGQRKMLVTCRQMAAIPDAKIGRDDQHYINHVEWSPDGSRFLFLNRGGKNGLGFTRMFTANADGDDLRQVDDGSSHYAWRDPRHIIIWNDGYYRLLPDDGSMRGQLVWKAPNGHETYLPGNQWLITDTYPLGKQRQQVLMLFHLPTRRVVPLGYFHLPPEYKGEWRCDTHPRLSPDAKWVCFDSPHGGNGRQLYLMDIREFVRAAEK